MDEMENIRWMITRLDKVIEMHKEWAEEDIEEFDNFAKIEIKNLEKTRNGALTIIGFLISVVIGLASKHITPYPIEATISALLFGGVATYLIFSIFKHETAKIFETILRSLNGARGGFGSPLGAISTASFSPDLYKIKDYENFYFYFFTSIVPALNIETLNLLKKSMNSVILSKVARKYLNKLYDENKKAIEKGVKDYENGKISYESNPLVLDYKLEYGNSLLDYKKTLSNKS